MVREQAVAAAAKAPPPFIFLGQQAARPVTLQAAPVALLAAH